MGKAIMENIQQEQGASAEEELHKQLSEKAARKYFWIRAMIKGIGKIVALMPEKLTYRLCVALAMAGYYIVPKFRRLARGHLEIAFGGDKTPAEIDGILKRSYANQGKNMAEFLMIPHKSAAWVNGKIKYNDPHDSLRTELKKGKGVVAVGGHIGNIELVCAWLGVNEYPMVTIVKAQRDELFTKFIMEVRNRWGTEMIFRARGVKEECFRQLELNKIVGLVADQNAARGGVFVDFFGKKAATVTGPADIAVKAGLPVVPSFMTTRNPDDTLTLHVLDPIPMRDTGNREEDLAHNVQLYTTALENFVREYPEEYLWWHQRWKTQAPVKDLRDKG